MIDFVLYFNQEYIFTKTHVQLLYEFQIIGFLRYLKNTCAAHRFQRKIQDAINWTSITILNSLRGVFLFDIKHLQKCYH